MQLGELEVIPLSDGVCLMPPEYFPNADWSAHQALFGPDGTMRLPIGCFLVRTGDQTVLIDAGLGPATSAGSSVATCLRHSPSTAHRRPTSTSWCAPISMSTMPAGWSTTTPRISRMRRSGSAPATGTRG